MIENPNLGGNVLPIETNDAIPNIPKNRTLMIEQLTDEAPDEAQIVYSLKTIEDVFNHFQPAKEVELKKEDGSLEKDKFTFNNLGDFGLRGLIGQSELLRNLEQQEEDYMGFVKKLSTNKGLQRLLANKEKKAAYLAALNSLIELLD